MQPRSERQKILWAVFLSLLLHLVVGVSIASFGDKLQPSLPEDEKPVELTIVNLAPMPTPPTGPKNTPFIDTTEQTETKEEPKEKTFESNANSIAASELPALGIAPIPTQEGKELRTTDLKNRQHSLDGEGAQAQPVSRPAPAPSITPQATPQPAPRYRPAPRLLLRPSRHRHRHQHQHQHQHRQAIYWQCSAPVRRRRRARPSQRKRSVLLPQRQHQHQCRAPPHRRRIDASKFKSEWLVTFRSGEFHR